MNTKVYEPTPARRVAFLGLGVMGYPMAGHLARAGHRVTVYNRSPAKAQAWVAEYHGLSAPTPRQAAEGAEFVFACVGNDADLRSVVLGPDGALAGMAEGAVFVDHTTASAEVARELQATAVTGGLHFVDAPVSGGQAGADEAFPQVDLVRAAHHRDRIVDDRHAFGYGALGEAVGVVGDRGCLADHQRVEFGEAVEVLLRDRLDLDAIFLGEARPVFQALDVGGRERFVGVVEDGDRPFGDGAGLGVLPDAASIGGEAFDEELHLLVFEAGEGRKLDALDLVVAGLAVLAGGDDESGRAVPVEKLAGEFAEALVLDFAEADKQALRDRAVLGEFVEVLVEQLLEDRDRIFVQVAVGQVEHGLDGGDDAVAAGVDPAKIIIDPGLGFAKTAQHNWALLAALPTLVATGIPVLIGASRKRFLGALLADGDGAVRPPDGRETATAVISALAARAGVWGVRVHDVRASADALAVVSAWWRGEQAPGCAGG